MFALFHYDRIDSTNLEARRLIESGSIKSKSVIFAYQQTAGQGSRGRKWRSDKSGNLLATYIFPIEKDWPVKNYLALYPVSLSVYAFIFDLLETPQNIQIKWPNDLLLNEEKIGGMLHEIVDYNGQFFFIAGIGLNIAWHPEQTDNFPATSLARHLTKIPALPNMVHMLGQYINDEISCWKSLSFDTYKQKLDTFL